MARRRKIIRVVALVAAYNEERFIGGCIEHLASQGVETYLIDNESTDGTVEIARQFLGNGLIGLETLPRNACFDLEPLLARKEQLASEIDADWLMHHDADEIRIAPDAGQRLVDAFTTVEAAGYNAVNFQEFTFVPTAEEPDHDHERFRETMRWYYPLLPSFPHRLNAWKRRSGGVDLTSSAGHIVSFAGLRMYPHSFPMKHYIILSRAHAARKYAVRRRGPDELGRGWGGWRNTVALRPEAGPLPLPKQAQLRRFVSDEELDASRPETQHIWAAQWAEALSAKLG